jgi:hypothetical protein
MQALNAALLIVPLTAAMAAKRAVLSQARRWLIKPPAEKPQEYTRFKSIL